MTLLEIVLPIIGLAWLAVFYTRRPARPVDHVCARVDDDTNARPVVVGSGLDVLAEDDQWAGIEDEWHAFIDGFGVRS